MSTPQQINNIPGTTPVYTAAEADARIAFNAVKSGITATKITVDTDHSVIGETYGRLLDGKNFWYVDDSGIVRGDFGERVALPGIGYVTANLSDGTLGVTSLYSSTGYAVCGRVFKSDPEETMTWDMSLDASDSNIDNTNLDSGTFGLGVSTYRLPFYVNEIPCLDASGEKARIDDFDVEYSFEINTDPYAIDTEKFHLKLRFVSKDDSKSAIYACKSGSLTPLKILNRFSLVSLSPEGSSVWSSFVDYLGLFNPSGVLDGSDIFTRTRLAKFSDIAPWAVAGNPKPEGGGGGHPDYIEDEAGNKITAAGKITTTEEGTQWAADRAGHETEAEIAFMDEMDAKLVGWEPEVSNDVVTNFPELPAGWYFYDAVFFHSNVVTIYVGLTSGDSTVFSFSKKTVEQRIESVLVRSVNGAKADENGDVAIGGHTITMECDMAFDYALFNFNVVHSNGEIEQKTIGGDNPKFETYTDVAYIFGNTCEGELVVKKGGASYKIMKRTGYQTPFFFPVLVDGLTLLGYTDTPCFAKGTLITLADWSEKPCEEITYDDDLLVWDFDVGRWSHAKPIWVKRAQTTNFHWHDEFSDGRTLDTVGPYGHRVLDIEKGRWEYDTDTVGSIVKTIEGTTELKSCTRVEDTTEFYNIITDRHINLVANGILTSSSRNNLYPIMDMKFVKRPVSVRTENEFFWPSEKARKFFLGCRLYETSDSVEEVNRFIMQKWATDIENEEAANV